MPHTPRSLVSSKPIRKTGISPYLITTLLISLVGCKLDGTFMQVNQIPQSSITAYLDELQSLQMNTVITSTLRHRDACGASPWQWYPTDSSGHSYLEALLTAADTRNIKVYLGLPQADGPCIYNPAEGVLVDVQEEHRRWAEQVEHDFGSHASFAGWHITYEPELAKFWSDSDPQVFYATMNAKVKAESPRPTLVSPIMNDFDDGLLSPQELGRRAKVFWQKTGIDIQVWQLTLGAIAIWNRPGRHTLKEYAQEISIQLGKSRFWGNYESFNVWPNYDDERPRGGDYKPSAVSNLFGATSLTNDLVAKKVTWIQQVMFGTVDQTAPIGARRMRDTYKAAFGIQGAIRSAGGGYIYSGLAPDPAYPDSGNELFDSKTGDPLIPYFNVDDWVGVHGDVAVDIVLDANGAAKRVDWVAVHVWNANDYGIRFPAEIKLRCAATVGGGLDSIGSWANPLQTEPDGTYGDSVYVLGNTAALNANCAVLRVRLSNPGWWTFLSEIEIASSTP